MAGRRRAWRAGGGDGALLEGSGWELTRAAETGELGEAEAARRGAMEVDGAEKSQARCGAWGSGSAQGHSEEADLRADAYLAAGGSRCGG